MQEMQEHLDKVKIATTRSLSRLVIKALDDARVQIEAQAMRYVGAKLPPINEQAPGIAERFGQNLYNYFDELTTLVVKDSEIEPDNYDNLSLVDHDYLEAMIAMEGMVKQMRDKEFKGARSFQTRLETMFPNISINETNNPLDPEQIGDCFNESIRPLGLKAHYLLTIYREFNKTVFGAYESILDEANTVLAESGVLPNLDITAEERERRKQQRAKARAQLEAELQAKQQAEEEQLAARSRKPAAPEPAPTPAEDRPARNRPAPANAAEAAPAHSDMFAMMQTLVQSLASKQGAALPVDQGSADLAADQADLRAQQQKLMSMLSEIQANLNGSGQPPGSAAEDTPVRVGESINQSLQAHQADGSMAGIDRQSSDVINLVTMLYQAIWNDRALPVVMKEMIGRTQISMMKVALADTDFFDQENHPGRALLNELALAGVAWTVTEDLDNDPVYSKVREIVERMLAVDNPDSAFLQSLVDELRQFTRAQTGADANLEKRIRESDNVSSNMDDVHAYVKQKINERVLKGYLDPAIRKLLDTHIHNFLVKLVLKEGPEGRSWKPVMSTIDVLLWTVQVEKQPGDRDRFNRINPRLLENLKKALELGGASKTKITKAMRQIKQIQEYTFHKAEMEQQSGSQAAALDTSARREPPPLPRDDPHLRRVDKMPLGTWFEFRTATGEPIRVALVAKIDSIEKLFFANKEGKKVAELTRNRLANELKSGTVKIVSEGSLVNRAMEKVIAELKNSAASQENPPKDVATA